MHPAATILLVEDDDFAAVVAAEMLADHYNVKHVSSGEAALDCMSSEPHPDLVLLDVAMPGISGYDVCRKLRDNSLTCGIPVIFLSGLVNEQERLAGYDAGGDDYLVKPVSADELRSKIQRQLTNHAERKQLKRDLSSAFSTAMTAMSNAAEVGSVLQFLKASFRCSDYESLCQEILSTLQSHGFDASVQLRGKQGVISEGNSGQCSPLEESVLTTMASHGRLFEFSSRTSCSYEHVTIIVRSDALADPERHGRMKDNLALLAEATDARVTSLDKEEAVTRQHQLMSKLIASTRQALQRIDQRQRLQGQRSGQIFQLMQNQFERSLLTLGITHSQEEELAEILQTAATNNKDLHEEGLELGKDLEDILQQLDRAGA
jgi:DNA-binding response OmpR family regulator